MTSRRGGQAVRRLTGGTIACVTVACASQPSPPAAPVTPRDSIVATRDSLPPQVATDTAPIPQPSPIRAALPVRLTFTGDINLGTSTLPDGIPPDSGRGLLGQVDSLLRGNLVIGNFEGVLADTGISTKCDLVFEALAD